MQPLIGITCDYDSTEPGKFWLREEYAAAVLSAGGLPVLLAPLEELNCVDMAGRLNGLVITGGDFDIEPGYYGEEPLPGLGKANPRRSKFELEMARWAFHNDLPTLGICGGMQAINVALGGTLYQDIAGQRPEASLNHEKGRALEVHELEVKPDTLLGSLLRRTRIGVNSSHHQAVKKAAPPCVVSAVAPDGVIEAIEAPGARFMMGLQWHPEALFRKDRIWLALFKALVKRAD